MTDLGTIGALVASALGVGSATFIKGLITEGAKDLYGQLRNRVVRLSEPAVLSLEEKPGVPVSRQGVITEIVDECGDAEKRELASLARALIEALGEQGDSAGTTNIVIATNGGHAAGRDQTINYGVAAPTYRKGD